LSGIFALLVAATAATVLVPSPVAAQATLVASWQMDETSGSTMTDSSGRGNNGTLHNVELGLPGHTNLAYGFGTIGLPSFVDVPHNDVLNPGTQNITLAMWARFPDVPPAAVGDYDMVRKGLSKTSGGSYKMEIFPRKSGTIGRALCQFTGSQSTRGKVVKGPDLSDNNWHFIQCRKTATTVELTVDSTTFTKSVTVGSIANTDNIYVGAKSPLGEDQYTGSMDEVTITIG
jgi:hypothetical protein